MVEPLFEGFQPVAINFQVGDLVSNFGQIARIIAIDPERGFTLRAMPGQHFSKGHDKWLADPAKCSPVL